MRVRKVLVPIALPGCFLLAAGAASAQSSQSNLRVTYPTGFTVSPPLSQIRPGTLRTTTLPNAQTIIPLRPLPLAGAGGLAPSLADRALQTAPGAPLELDDDGGKPRFPGQSADGYAPPDPNLAVGPNHVVQIVNTEFTAYSKSGTIFAGYPKTIGSLFSALGGNCASDWGDPIVQYDRAADRWVITQLGNSPLNAPPYFECLAVSQTNDPTGAYNLYSYSFPTYFNDYPKIGVWPTATNSAYTATYNLFTTSDVLFGVELCAYDRAAMLSGAASPASICYAIANDLGYLPADLDGSTLPPAGSPAYFLNFETRSSLRLYQLTPNFANPSSSTLSAPMDIAVDSFFQACAGIPCIPQPATSQALDSLGDRLMYRLAYRNFGDHDALVVNHSVATATGTGVRWYELRSPLTGAFTVFQQGTFAPDSTSRWMASAAMDQAGDIAIGYSASSTTVFPAIRYTGRTPSDAPGTMRTETSMLEGTGSQTNYLSRWGDYTAMRVDPSDDCTFWYTNQYQPGTGSFNWATFIGTFKFTNCGAPAPGFSVSPSPASQTVVQGNPAGYTVTVTPSGGFTGNVSLSATGLPSGASAAFSPNSITGGSGSSRMSVATSASTSVGTYSLTITGTSGSLSHSTSVTLVVNPAAAGGFSISASPSSQTVTQGSGTSYIATVAPSGGFTGNVSLSASGLPSGASAAFSPNSITGGSGSSSMSVATSASTPVGTYTLTITGTSGSLTHSTTVALVVNSAGSANFSITGSPSSQTVAAGNPASYSATVTPSGGFTGSVSLSVSGLPSGASATFSPNSIAGGSGNSTMRVTTSTNTPAGSYTLTITGTSGSLTHSTTVALVVNGFSISASPSSQTVTRGNSGMYTATLTAINGFSGTVTLTVRGLPSNSSASFNPSSVTGHGTSTLTISTNSSTLTGSFTLRIRGSSGGVTHSTTVQLVVQ